MLKKTNFDHSHKQLGDPKVEKPKVCICGWNVVNGGWYHADGKYRCPKCHQILAEDIKRCCKCMEICTDSYIVCSKCQREITDFTSL